MKRIIFSVVMFFVLMGCTNSSLASDGSKVMATPQGKEIKLEEGAEAVPLSPDPIERYNQAFFKFRIALPVSSNSLPADPAKVITPPVGSEIRVEEKTEAAAPPIPDPIERYNRDFFKFNDKLYFWVLKPVATGYGKVLHRRARLSVQNFFWNVYSPVRMINCGLQCKFQGASTELARFGINTTLGAVGFFDPAKNWFHLEMQEEDFGQTLGCYKGSGFYINLPFVGSTSLRDGIGSLVDMCIVPSMYVLTHYGFPYVTGAEFLEIINRTSLRIGDYEELKRAALDPYIAVRDAYNQHREELIKE